MRRRGIQIDGWPEDAQESLTTIPRLENLRRIRNQYIMIRLIHPHANYPYHH